MTDGNVQGQLMLRHALLYLLFEISTIFFNMHWFLTTVPHVQLEFTLFLSHVSGSQRSLSLETKRALDNCERWHPRADLLLCAYRLWLLPYRYCVLARCTKS